MSWTYATLLALLAVLLALSLSPETAESAAVDSSTRNAKSPAGQLRRIFMKEADASNFFRKRTRRAVKSTDEINGEFGAKCLVREAEAYRCMWIR
ncbi:unique cartilage matrix-associated protein-like [Poecilia reticulata]|uniref:unique cartilage matrix-associated protein-like n=1 Tax=Poecilia reticulata TaxID=8081 RepID=UPI0004A282CE|nr:PREDICTED: unique cartilage matrix-associated protein-like [Poecilia reticulata]